MANSGFLDAVSCAAVCEESEPMKACVASIAEGAPEPLAIDFDFYRAALFDEKNEAVLARFASDLCLSKQLFLECGLGYDEATESLVIPIDECSAYTVKLNEATGDIPYSIDQIGTPGIYRSQFCPAGDVLFVTQDPVSSIALANQGYPSIAVMPGALETFARMIKAHEIFSPLAVWLDHTPEGIDELAKVKAILDAEEYPYQVVTALDRYSHPIIAMKKCADFVGKILQKTVCRLGQHTSMKEYIDREMDIDVDRFSKCKDFVSGFDVWDREMCHFGPGVTVLCAEPGAGKSTLVMQIASNLARRKIPVMIFSTELSRVQMVSKFISGMCYELDHNTKISALDIMDGLMTAEIDKARAIWRDQFAPYITVNDKLTTAAKIAEAVRERVRTTGVVPFVIIDYIQRLQSDDPAKASDLRLVNTETSNILCSLGLELTVPILAVSSIARSQYGGSFTLGVAKESGAIEYDAVTLLYLAPTIALDTEKNDSTKKSEAVAKAVSSEMGKDERDMSVVVLKNRYMKGQSKIRMRFLAAHDTYEVYCEHCAQQTSGTASMTPQQQVPVFEEIGEDDDLPF